MRLVLVVALSLEGIRTGSVLILFIACRSGWFWIIVLVWMGWGWDGIRTRTIDILGGG